MRRALRARVLDSRLGSVWYRFWELRQALGAEARRENRRLREHLPADGFPVPSAQLIVSIGSNASTAWYLESGPRDTARILEQLSKAGLDPARLGTVLDFGCGCGRLTRGLAAGPAQHVIGCDVNRAAISWCRHNLPGDYHALALDPPLPLDSESVDVAIAYSVFTHLDPARADSWQAELHRVLAPGGTLVLTAHGAAYRELLSGELGAEFDAGEPVVRYERSAGSNLCAAFHPRAFLEAKLGERFTVVSVEEGSAAHAAPQDLYVCRK